MHSLGLFPIVSNLSHWYNHITLFGNWLKALPYYSFPGLTGLVRNVKTALLLIKFAHVK